MVRHFMQSRVGSAGTMLVVNSGGQQEVDSFGDLRPSWDFSLFQPGARAATQSGDMSNFTNGIAELPSQELSELSNITTTFDAASCTLLLHFLETDETKLDLLTEIAKHLRPGSPLALVTLTGDKHEPEFERQLAAWRMNLECWSNETLSKTDIERELDQVRSLPLITQGRLSELMNEAGFEQSTLFYATYFCRGWIALKKS